MRRGSMLTTLLAIVGIALTFIQVAKRNSRKSGWRMMGNRMNDMLQPVLSGSSRMWHSVRSLVRM